MWKLSEARAEWTTPHFQATVHIAEPWLGLRDLRFANASLPNEAAVLQTHVRELVASNNPVVETYVRGRDLVATYAPSPSQPVHLQIYWRALELPELNAAGMELILSARTDLLDSRPHAKTCSLFPQGTWLRWTGTGNRFEAVSHAPSSSLYLMESPQLPWRYCESIPASEVASITPAPTAHELAWNFFSQRLEKGVILRSRVCGIFLLRDDDRAAAVIAAERCSAEPLPLTT